MPDKVLIYSRFPRSVLGRFAGRFELLDAAGKPPQEVFPAEELVGIRAFVVPGAEALRPPELV